MSHPDILRNTGNSPESHETASDMSLVLLAPGQGGQRVGMGNELAKYSSAAAGIWKLAEEMYGSDFTKLVKEGPKKDLSRTINAQRAIITDTLARKKVLDEMGIKTNAGWVTGHSVGFIAALNFVGSISDEDTLYLIQERGKATQEVCDLYPTSMAAFVNIPRETRHEAAEKFSLELCLDNTPTQQVYGGLRENIEKAEEWIGELGLEDGDISVLDVAGAFHTSHMKAALPKFKAAIDTINIRPPRFGNLIGISRAEVLISPYDIRQELSEQLFKAVQWRAIMENLRGTAGMMIELNEASRLTNMTTQTLGGTKESIAWSSPLEGTPSPTVANIWRAS